MPYIYSFKCKCTVILSLVKVVLNSPRITGLRIMDFVTVCQHLCISQAANTTPRSLTKVLSQHFRVNSLSTASLSTGQQIFPDQPSPINELFLRHLLGITPLNLTDLKAKFSEEQRHPTICFYIRDSRFIK